MRLAQQLLLALLLTFAGGLLCSKASAEPALTTKSPEVLRAIDRGIKYLESNGANESRVGGQALVGMALLLYNPKANFQHPKVLAAVSGIEKAIANRDASQANDQLDIYSTGLSIIFLIERDPTAHRGDIEYLLSYLRARQKKHGGWGYPERTTGDTSMTQYGVLSSWEALNHHFTIPMESIDAVTGWLLRTQDPGGAFGYQGTIAESPNNLVKQQEIRHSMAAAGLGSLYICSHMLGMEGQPEKPKSKGLPPALREVKPKNAKPDPTKFKSTIEPKLVHEAKNRGNGWFEQNFKVQVDNYNLYYLYAFERYKSIAEICDKKEDKDPQWYSDIAEFLVAKQSDKGTWNAGCGDVPDTAFGVLFLMRSMKRRIEEAKQFGDGTMIGGRGFPKDTSSLAVDRFGQVKQRKLLTQADELLAALDDPEGKNFDKSIEQLPELPKEQIESLSLKHAEMIRRLVSNKKWETRLAAVKLMGKARDLDNVPVLIYALTDPEPAIVREANEALLRISRNPSLVRIPENLSDSERRLIIEKWKAWYHAVRPGAHVDL